MLPEILHRIFYGLLSGLTEFLPVGSQPHQLLYQHVTGFLEKEDPWLNFAVLAGAFAALIFCLLKQYAQIHHDIKLDRHAKRRKIRGQAAPGALTSRLYKTVMIPMLIACLFYGYAQRLKGSFPVMIILLVLNGIVVFIPRLLPIGDKDGKNISRLEGILFGLCAAAGIVPGLSRVGLGCALGEARGAKPSYIINVILLALVWPMALIVLFTLFGVMSSQVDVATGLIFADLGAGVCSFGAAVGGISLLRWFVDKLGLYKFAFYSWVLALVLFILYMFV